MECIPFFIALLLDSGRNLHSYFNRGLSQLRSPHFIVTASQNLGCCILSQKEKGQSVSSSIRSVSLITTVSVVGTYWGLGEKNRERCCGLRGHKPWEEQHHRGEWWKDPLEQGQACPTELLCALLLHPHHWGSLVRAVGAQPHTWASSAGGDTEEQGCRRAPEGTACPASEPGCKVPLVP